MQYNPLEQYKKAEYINEVSQLTASTYAYKFESPSHFIAVIEEVQKSGIRNTQKNSSEENGEDFSGSRSMNHAIEMFRTEKFDSVFARNASILVNQMRQRAKITDEGEEISVPEYLAKADHFIQYTGKNYKRPVIMDIPLFIQCTYSAGESHKEMLDVGKNLLTAMYQMKIRCPKIVFMFVSENWNDIPGNSETEKHAVFIDCNFTDFNSFSKMLLPSTFRRLWFRLAEMHSGVPWGYGHCWEPRTGKLEDGVSLLMYKNNSSEMVKKDIEKKVKEYALRSSMVRNKNITA